MVIITNADVLRRPLEGFRFSWKAGVGIHFWGRLVVVSQINTITLIADTLIVLTPRIKIWLDQFYHYPYNLLIATILFLIWFIKM